jgi:hypothetical protein
MLAQQPRRATSRPDMTRLAPNLRPAPDSRTSCPKSSRILANDSAVVSGQCRGETAVNLPVSSANRRNPFCAPENGQAILSEKAHRLAGRSASTGPCVFESILLNVN